MCDKKGNQLKFHRALNPGYVPSSGDGELFGLDATLAIDDLVLPINLRENVWNEISENSFQAVFMYSDLVITEYRGGFSCAKFGHLHFSGRTPRECV